MEKAHTRQPLRTPALYGMGVLSENKEPTKTHDSPNCIPYIVESESTLSFAKPENKQPYKKVIGTNPVGFRRRRLDLSYIPDNCGFIRSEKLKNHTKGAITNG